MVRWNGSCLYIRNPRLFSGVAWSQTVRHTLVAGILGASLLAAVGTASAAYTPYFGEDLNDDPDVALTAIPNSSVADAAFRSLLSGVGTETFETQTTGALAPLTLSFPGFSSPISATLSGGGGRVAAVTPGTTDGFGRYSIPSDSSSKYWRVDAGGTAGSFMVTFSRAIAAFGFYGVDIGDQGGRLELDLLAEDLTSIVASVTVPNTEGVSGSTDGSVLFFGLVAGSAAEDFFGVRVRTTSGATTDVFAFDNFTIAERNQVTPPPTIPEPGTVALLGLALAGAGMARRRK